MYQYANDSPVDIRQNFNGLVGNELAILIGQKDETVYFTKAHVVDLRVVLSVEAAEVEGE